MEHTGIRAEERTGLIIAVVLHLAVLAMMVVQAWMPAPQMPQTQRMTVNLAEEVGLEATAPEPVPESRAAIAPVLSDTPAPEPLEASASATAPGAVSGTSIISIMRPKPNVQSPVPAPAQPRREQAAPKPAERAGGSRIGDNFLAGSGGSTTTDETRTPASQIGSSAKASLFQAVGRQLRPHWTPPSGPEVEKIVTKVRFRLNADGSLNGRPSVVGQSGVNDLNRTQAARHGEQAVRAVQLAAPFDLPEEYYEAWKLITVDFDWKLAQ